MTRKLIGTVGIDAGMLYLGDPCYVIDKPLGRKTWDDFMRDLYATSADGGEAQWWHVNATISETSPRTFPAGMVVTTGYGDGEYPVEVTLDKNGRITSVTVRFT